MDFERTLAGQLRGLEILLERCNGRSVLDLGCAEGLIGIEFALRGASLVHGVELVRSRVDRARACAEGVTVGERARFFDGDLDEDRWDGVPWMRPSYDIVLALAIAHKMSRPDRFIEQAVRRCGAWFAIGLPPSGPIVHDRRSGFEMFDTRVLLRSSGFALVLETERDRGEWLGIWRRREPI